MDTALQSSVYVSSPEFAGWLMKRGFHVIFFSDGCFYLQLIFILSTLWFFLSSLRSGENYGRKDG